MIYELHNSDWMNVYNKDHKDHRSKKWHENGEERREVSGHLIKMSHMQNNFLMEQIPNMITRHSVFRTSQWAIQEWHPC